MKIAVLVKQVPGSESSLPINSDQNWIDEDQVSFVMNPPDNYAIEEALLIKEKLGLGEVVIISKGPDRVQKIIREGLAKGADRGIHLVQEGLNTDPLASAKSFSKIMKSENFDLILSGLQSDDLGLSQTGVLIGEMLGYSTATLVVETVIEGNSLKVKRELESGWFQWVSFPFPASISIQSGLNSPRYPSLKGIMGAKRKEIRIISENEHSDSSKQQYIEKISLPTANKKTEIIEGDSEETIDRIINILKSEIKVL